MVDEDSEEGSPLNSRSYMRWIESELSSLTDAVITPGKSIHEYDVLRGRIIMLKKSREVFLNKKK
jgi:hypothetical protein